jgi:hypothetical protein
MNDATLDDRINGLEAWKKVWREGIVLSLNTPGLEALRRALATGDRRVVQSCTAWPKTAGHGVCQDRPVGYACALGFCGWQGEGLETVGEVEAFVAKVCFETDQRLNNAAVWRFINWYDATQLETARRELLPEIDRELARRGVTV